MYFCKMKTTLSKLLQYFIQGLIIISPILITVYAAYFVFDIIDKIIPGMPRGLGFVAVLSILILVGWLGNRFLLWRLLINFFDSILEKTPFLKLIYTSVKDFADGFLGDKRKFTKPVLITIKKDPQIQRIGFVTQDNLEILNLNDKVMVYVPHSYNFSGNLFIVDKSNVTPLDIDSGSAMKLAVSGGVAGFDEEGEEDDKLLEAPKAKK